MAAGAAGRDSCGRWHVWKGGTAVLTVREEELDDSDGVGKDCWSNRLWRTALQGLQASRERSSGLVDDSGRVGGAVWSTPTADRVRSPAVAMGGWTAAVRFREGIRVKPGALVPY